MSLEDGVATGIHLAREGRAARRVSRPAWGLDLIGNSVWLRGYVFYAEYVSIPRQAIGAPPNRGAVFHASIRPFMVRVLTSRSG